MVASLAAAGISRLHIFAHSMGARLLCCSLPLLTKHLLPAGQEEEAPSAPKKEGEAEHEAPPRISLHDVGSLGAYNKTQNEAGPGYVLWLVEETFL